MPYRDDAGPLVTWMHRRGVARRVNSSYSGTAGWYRCTVDTVVPLRWLAGVANRPETGRLLDRERIDRWRWRWTFGRASRP